MPEPVILRLADERDRWQVFAWKNLPENIAVSGSGLPVTAQEHRHWFDMTLKQQKRLLWMIEPGIGFVRADRRRHSWHAAWLSIYVIPLARGLGVGKASIQIACRKTQELWPEVREFWAAIGTDNYVSARAFCKAGFSPMATPKEIPHVRYFAYLPESDRGQSGTAHAPVHSLSGGDV